MSHDTRRCADFVVATASPLGLESVPMALATVRAGGVGLVDAVHVLTRPSQAAVETIGALTDGVPVEADACIGLRCAARQIPELDRVLEALTARSHWLVVVDWTPSAARALLEGLTHPSRAIWLEVGSADQLRVASDDWAFAGWCGRGIEGGGLGGRQSTFVLAQHLARQSRPFVLSGGIGEHAAAASRAAGARGVVIDDAVLLLRESPVPPHWRHKIADAGLTDTRLLGEGLGRAVRVLDRPDLRGARQAGVRATALACVAEGGNRAADWQAAASALVGWGEPDRHAWPIGEAVALAHGLAARHRTIGRLVQSVAAISQRSLALAATQAPFAEGAPLAASLGTRFPIVQGPMTRVSDVVPFAEAVAGGGALPLLALALMRGPEIVRLLDETRAVLADQPWGVGLLGFVPDDLWREQVAAVVAAKPPFALVAGGRPNHATELEAHGIATFLHVPASLIQHYLDAGVRRFVFEGAECGGHIGPLHGFTLWDYAATVLSQLSLADASRTQVLFAGGIHDDVSAAMVAAMAAPLVERGIQVGVLMGTAYLFTEEAVSRGAISNGFQTAALSNEHTVTIATGPGHVIRCAPSPFVEAFDRNRSTLAASGLTGDALQSALERLIVGRARVASKGVSRVGDALVAVGTEQQQAEGLYMLGDIAGLRATRTTITDLHCLVSAGSATWLGARASDARSSLPLESPARPANVAIIGAACLVPGAQDLESFWRHVLDGTPAITEVPAERWDARLYYDSDPAAKDRINSKWGGFVSPIAFEPARYGLPPRSVPSITPPQLIALELTRLALLDAGYDQSRPEAAVRARTAVVFAAGNTGDLEQLYMTRAALPLVATPGSAEFDRLPEWTEESYPGLLANVVAGRVANRFDFGGPNLTVDAACASSLAALDLAVRELQEGRSDLVVTGGLEFEMSPQAYMGFSKTRALSPRGRAAVFDTDADGIVISEGGVVFVLKRLDDARRDGDRVYAVIKSVAGSSDGRGLSLTAPKPDGQRVAMTRAYATAGVSPSSIGLYEAHGTGTVLGDAAELSTITAVLEEGAASAGGCVVGSLKSLLGHTRTAAGMVAVLKTALSLHHRVRPPHHGVQRPLTPLEAKGSPLRLLRAPEPWLAAPGTARRAGVSAFGFGGTNFHAVLEEAPQAAANPAAPAGSAEWPYELFVVAAADAPSLDRQLTALDAAAGALGRGAHFRFRDLAYTSAVAARGSAHRRAAIVAASPADLRERIAALRAQLAGALEGPAGAVVGEGEADGKVGFLFPGQGSQQPGMGRDLACVLREVRRTVEEADRLLADRPVALSRVMWPEAAFDREAGSRQRRALADTATAQPAIGALSCGLLDALRRVGVSCEAVAGHSYGEFVALHAAGVMSRGDLVRLSAARGAAMAAIPGDAGAMAAVAASGAEVSDVLAGIAGVVIANRNAPRQVVISGTTEGVRVATERLTASGHGVVPLPVSAAFHSPLMAPAREALSRAFRDVAFQAPSLPVHANLDGRPYGAEAGRIASRLIEHLETPVDFTAAIEHMYDSGVRTFVEVGPGRVLSGLVARILEGRVHTVCTCDGGVREWLEALAVLFVRGHAVDLVAAHADRPVEWIDLERLPAPSDMAGVWWLDGSRAWPMASVRPSVGARAFRTAESAVTSGAPDDSLTAEGSGVVANEKSRASETGRGAVVLEVYREYERTMRGFLEQQERMFTRAIERAGSTDTASTDTASTGCDLPVPIVPGAPERAAPHSFEDPALAGPGIGEPVQFQEAHAVSADASALTALIRRLVSARTGYGDDALALDADLEADLGIDSIKRIEIFVSLTKTLPALSASEGLLDRLVRLRTLGAVVDQVTAVVGPATTNAGQQPMALSTAQATDPSAPIGAETLTAAPGCTRLVMRPRAAPLERRADAQFSGLHLIVGGDGELADMVDRRLRRLGAHPMVVSAAEAAHLPAARASLDRARRVHGPVHGVIDLLGTGTRQVGDLETWARDTRESALTRLALLQACEDDLATRVSRPLVLVVTASGGAWGRSDATSALDACAASHGLLRSFSAEHPRIGTRMVDIAPGLAPEAVAGIVAGEYEAHVADLEVAWRGSERVVFEAARAPLETGASPDVVLPLEPGAVVMATGGASGITAELCRALSAPGVRLVLVGRRPSVDDARLRALRARGAEVEYHSVDVSDAARFGAVVNAVIAKYGRIDGVLHGAGVIADQRFAQKDASTFARVFNTKVAGAVTLASCLHSCPPAWVVFFGSVSGRFGNPGQADYATANEALNRLSWHLKRAWPSTRVVTINWGPWHGTGMATDGVVALLESRGIRAISVDEGCRFLLNELQYGRREDVEIIAGEGPWARESEAPASRLAAGESREPESAVSVRADAPVATAR